MLHLKFKANLILHQPDVSNDQNKCSHKIRIFSIGGKVVIIFSTISICHPMLSKLSGTNAYFQHSGGVINIPYFLNVGPVSVGMQSIKMSHLNKFELLL